MSGFVVNRASVRLNEILEERFKEAPEIIGDFFMAPGIGVNPIRLIEFRNSGDALKEEGDEVGMGCFCGLTKRFAKRRAVFFSHIGRCFHPDNDGHGMRETLLNGMNDRLEIIPNFIGGDAAEGVVSAEGDDKNVDGRSKHPGDSAAAARGGFTAKPPVNDLKGPIKEADLLLKACGISFAGGHTVPGGDAIAEDEDLTGVSSAGENPRV